MFCPECGQKIEDDIKICPYCNSEIEQDEDIENTEEYVDLMEKAEEGQEIITEESENLDITKNTIKKVNPILIFGVIIIILLILIIVLAVFNAVRYSSYDNNYSKFSLNWVEALILYLNY